MKKKIVVFSNDSFYYQNKFLNYQNKNTQTIIDILNSKFHIHLISRKSLKKTTGKKIIKQIKMNEIKFLIKDIKKNKDLRFLFISITPFNFIYFILLKIFLVKKKQIFVFLRSDGFKEYQIKFSILGYWVYYLMFKLFSFGSNFLSCSRDFLHYKKENKILLPSELDDFWFKKNKKIKLEKKIKILYIGRFRKEKGYEELVDMFKKTHKKINNYNLSLTLVGDDKKKKIKEKNLKVIKYINNATKLRNLYDTHQIFVLPSYTEGFPQVILESLARKKPVIVFQEIKFLRKFYHDGLFVSKRNVISFTNTIKYIIKNYNKILKDISKIKLISKREYKKNLLLLIK